MSTTSVPTNPVQSSEVTVAPPASSTITEEAGRIEGAVVSDQLEPIANATVTLGKDLAVALTGAAGSFSFHNVPIGDHAVLAEAPGYVPKATRVSVVAQEPTRLQIVLQPVQVVGAAYILSIPRVYNIDAGSDVVDYLVGIVHRDVPAAPNSSALCGQCSWKFQFDPRPVAWVAEAAWTSTSPAPYVNDRVNVRWVTSSPGCDCHQDTLSDPITKNGKWTATASELEVLVKANATMAVQNISGTVLSFGHRVTVWTTFAYVDALPEGFTALPKD